MKQPKHIQISVPKPCHERWEEMTPTEQGRHCARCRKTVVDFTTWSDAALYRYFSGEAGRVCGKFSTAQLNRPIHIPPQPHSRLYRMTIALGLTLLFVQGGEVMAQSKALVVQHEILSGNIGNDSFNGKSVAINGLVLDKYISPQANVFVSIVDGSGLMLFDTVTTVDGQFHFVVDSPGYYQFSFKIEGLNKSKFRGVMMSDSINALEVFIEPDELGRDLLVKSFGLISKEQDPPWVDYITGEVRERIDSK